MKYKNFKEFKEWFLNETINIPNRRVLDSIVINLGIFGPKKNIIPDDITFDIKGEYSNKIITNVYKEAIEDDQHTIEVYLEKLKAGDYKDYETIIGCVIGFVINIYSNYFILEVAGTDN